MPLFDYSFIYVYFFYIKIQLIADQVLRMAHLLKVATHIKLKLFVTVSFDLENQNNEINFCIEVLSSRLQELRRGPIFETFVNFRCGSIS